MGKNLFSFIKYYWKLLLSLVILIGLIIGTIVVTLDSSPKTSLKTESKQKENSQLVETPSNKNKILPKNSISPSENDNETGITDSDNTEKNNNYADDVTGPAKQKDVSRQAIIVNTNNTDSVCKAISDYVEENSKNYTGISETFLDITGTTQLWDNTPLNSYSSEDERYSTLEKWTTDANDTSGNDSYPVVTAIIQNNGDNYIIHGLYVGETNFIDDGQFPEEAWYK